MHPLFAASHALVRNVHQSIVSPANGTASPGQNPTPIVFGSVLGLQYDTINRDQFVEFKIPRYYADGKRAQGSSIPAASFHIHWTKSANASEAGNTVTWQIDYTVFPGNAGRIDQITDTLQVTDTYEDASVDGTRYAYRTANLDASANFVAGYYVGLKVSYVATTFVTSDPVLISCDAIIAQYANRTNKG